MGILYEILPSPEFGKRPPGDEWAGAVAVANRLSQELQVALKGDCHEAIVRKVSLERLSQLDSYGNPAARSSVALDIARDSAAQRVIILTTTAGFRSLSQEASLGAVDFEVLNKGLAASPVYVVAAGTLSATRPLRAAVYVRPAPFQADLGLVKLTVEQATRVITQNPAMTVASVDVVASPEDLLDRLCSDQSTARPAIDLAILHGDDPEPAVPTLLASPLCRGRNLQLLALDIPEEKGTAGVHGVSPSDEALLWIAYGDQTIDHVAAGSRGYGSIPVLPRRTFVPAVERLGDARSRTSVFPVIALNVRPGEGREPVEWIRSLLSNIYLTAAEEVERAMPAARESARQARQAQWSYLREAYISDKKDRLKGLSLYGRTMWLTNAKEKDPLRAPNCWDAVECTSTSEGITGGCGSPYANQRQTIIAKYVGMTLGVPAESFPGVATPQPRDLGERTRALAKWLGVPTPRDTLKREAFANKPQEIYDRALKAIDRVAKDQRSGAASEARQLLLIAAALNCRPTDLLRGHGLNRSFDYDPLLRLATIEARERLRRPHPEGRKQE